MASKVLLLAAFAVLAESWSYDRCDPLGPDGWNKVGQCGGSQQTPIDLCDASPLPKRASRRDDDDDDDEDKYGKKDGGKKDKKKDWKKKSYSYSLSDSYYDSVYLKLQNTGHTVQISHQIPGVSPSTWAPQLHKLVGRFPSDSVSNPEWVFAQMHLHWGRDGNSNEGSEHAVAGHRFAAEAHFVHFNKARGNTLLAAVQSGNNDALLVIGTFLEVGPSELETDLVRTISSYVPKLEKAPAKTLDIPEKLVLTDIIDPSGAFYTYGGGLTTPGCNEVVTWIVQQKPSIISVESLINLKTAMETPTEAISHFGNFRPLQPLGDRTLYLSKGASPICDKAVHPDTCFICEDNSHSSAKAASALSTVANPSETSCSSTPTWVWIVIGVAVPAAMLMGALAAVYFTVWRQRQISADEMVVFTPFPELQGVQPPSSAADVESVVGK